MNLLIFSPIFLLSASINAEEDHCQAITQDLVQYFSTPEQIRIQKDILKEEYCNDDDEDDPVGCKVGVESWWGNIVEALAVWGTISEDICPEG